MYLIEFPNTLLTNYCCMSGLKSVCPVLEFINFMSSKNIFVCVMENIYDEDA
jgi:hypothetical protein